MLKAFRECGFSCADHALDLSLKHAFKRAEAEVPELKQFRKSIKFTASQLMINITLLATSLSNLNSSLDYPLFKGKRLQLKQNT